MPRKDHLRVAELDGRIVGTRTSVHAYTHAVARVGFSSVQFRAAQFAERVSSARAQLERSRLARYQLAFDGLQVGDRHPCGVGLVTAEQLTAAAVVFQEAGGRTLGALVRRLTLEEHLWIDARCAAHAAAGVEVVSWHGTEERAVAARLALERVAPWGAYRLLPVRSAVAA